MAGLLSADGIDWRDQSRVDEITAYMVSPMSLTGNDGWLEDIRFSGCSIDANYYSQSRVSAKIQYEGDSWQRNRALRIHHTCFLPGAADSRDLGTFLVTRDDGDFESGRWVGDLTCQSMLWALSKRKLARPLTIKSGQLVHESIARILASCGRQYLYKGTDMYTRLGADKVYESGKTYSDVLDDLCEAGNIRLDVAGNGYILIAPWMPPDAMSPTFELDVDDPRGILHDNISRSSNFAELPSEVAVSCKYSVEVDKPDGVYESNSNGHKKGDPKYKKVSEQRELNSLAKVSGGPQSEWERGFQLTDFQTIDDKELNPKTQAEIDRRAHLALSKSAGECITWKVSTQYFPVWEGDVGYLVIPTEEGGDERERVKVLVRSLSLDLGSMQMDLTLQKTDLWNEEIYGLNGPDGTD